MVPKRTGFHGRISVFVLISGLVALLAITPVLASLSVDDDIPTEAYANPYNPYGWGNPSPYLPDVESTLTIEPLATPRPATGAGTSTAPSTAPARFAVTLSPFTADLGGKTTNLLVGSLSGTRTGVNLTIAGKESSATEFSDITPVTPDDNGLFVWAVPASRNSTDLFRVSARSGNTEVLSNAIRFSDAEAEPVADPVISPVKKSSSGIITTPSPVLTPVPVSSGEQSVFGLSRLTIRADTTTPAVGELVAITGKLTDQHGTGISGATVTIDESGYSGNDPLSTTVTGSDGSFTFSVGVSYADTVGMQARYDGDKTHAATDSNTIMFTAH